MWCDLLGFCCVCMNGAMSEMCVFGLKLLFILDTNFADPIVTPKPIFLLINYSRVRCCPLHLPGFCFRLALLAQLQGFTKSQNVRPRRACLSHLHRAYCTLGLWHLPHSFYFVVGVVVAAAAGREVFADLVTMCAMLTVLMSGVMMAAIRVYSIPMYVASAGFPRQENALNCVYTIFVCAQQTKHIGHTAAINRRIFF